LALIILVNEKRRAKHSPKGVLIMDMLEKVELVREKTGVSYQDARDALEANNNDVLDAIIWLEGQGKTETRTASYETGSTTTTKMSSPEMVEAQQEYHKSSKRTKFGEIWSNFCQEVKRIFRAGLDMTFIAERKGERVLAIPLLFVVIGILCWGAALWLLILGLFFGFRYRVEGASPLTIDVNDAMNKVADAAESIKDDFTKDE
jgi:hypothetical protein